MNRTAVKRVWLTEDAVWVELYSGARGVEYFADYSRLNSASPAQRENFNLSYFGIHWPDIDEDLSFEGFFQKAASR